jgi:hypothetical protein
MSSGHRSEAEIFARFCIVGDRIVRGAIIEQIDDFAFEK